MAIIMKLYGEDFQCSVTTENSIVTEVDSPNLLPYVGQHVASIILDHNINGISIINTVVPE